MKFKATISALAVIAAAPAFADCSEVTFSDVGWTDITTTTATATHILEGLGYDVDTKVLSVPVTFASLESDDVDVFLGNWIPAQSGAIQPYLDKGEIEQLVVNLEGTKYTLAVPTYTYERGLQSYGDIAKFEESLDGKIYGIEPGNEGNDYLIGLTENDTHGLGEFEVVESSEQGMLAMVSRNYKDEKDVVLPRLGTPPDERELQPEVPARRRRLLWR